MLAPDTMLHDRYLILSPLGQGGMGAVYQATDQKFGNQVAIKETFYTDVQLRGAFSQEAKLLNRLRHAALPVVMDYFAVGERQFLVMQFIPGKDLEQCLHEQKASGQGPFLTAQVLSWADQLLDALEYLHAQMPPIIHRDIKPQNLKLTPRGEIVLLDFGLAKGTQTGHSKSSKGIRGYTPNYASLEQIRGTGTDARSDIYSMGATLYHLLTGELPQDALTRIAAMLLGQPDPLRPITELNLEVPLSVAAVIDNAVSPNPDQRFETAALMRQALRNAIGNAASVSLHRTPTLMDAPIFSTIEVSASVALDHGSSGSPWRLDAGPDRVDQIDQANLSKDIPGQEIDNDSSIDASQSESPALEPSATQSTFTPVSRFHPSILAVCAMILVFAIAVLGIFRFQIWGNGLIASINKLAVSTQANASGPSLAIPMRVEAMRYFIEIAPGLNQSTRATGLMPLSEGSRFKFHFKPHQSGYLYIIALGAGDFWQTFLTNSPMPASGVITNRVIAGRDFLFPDGGQWFMMQPDADTTPFTVIFSPKPLTSPSFLTNQSGHGLSQNEIQDFAEFRKIHTAQPAELVAVADNNQPAVTVQVSAERPNDAILVFDISLKKR
ncbi:MAG: protein kinase [Acidobacteria bacterium]|nr:protein kinase [Acidobacteriota bacterium]